MAFDFAKYNTPIYIFLIVFIILTVSALLFADRFKFLQSKQESTDSSGKCSTGRCCKACSLNLPLVLIFSAGIGGASVLAWMLLQKSHRDKLKDAILGSGVAPTI